MNFCKVFVLLTFLADCYLVGVPSVESAPLLKGSQTSRTGGHTSSRTSSRSGSGWGGTSSRSRSGTRSGSSWGSSRPSSSRSGSSSSWGWGSSRNRGGSSSSSSRYGGSSTPKKTSTARKIWNKIRGKKTSTNSGYNTGGHSSFVTKKPSIGRRIYNKIRGKGKHTTGSTGSHGSSGHRSKAGRIWDKLRGKKKPVTPRPSTFGSSGIGGGGHNSWGSGRPSSGSYGSTGISSAKKSGWKTKAKSMLKKLAASSAAKKVGKKLFAKISGRHNKRYNQQYGRNYWYGNAGYYNDPDRYHVGQRRMSPLDVMSCEYQMPVGNSGADYDVQFEYDDGRPIQRIMFNCDKRYEICCGLECCPRPRRRWGFGRGKGSKVEPLGLAKIVGVVTCLLYSKLVIGQILVW